MAEEEVVAAGVSSAAPALYKRKLEDFEPEAPEPENPDCDEPVNPNADPGTSAEADFLPSDETEAKRPRLNEKPDEIVSENGHQEEKTDDPIQEDDLQPAVDNNEPALEEVPETVNDEQQQTAGNSEDHSKEEATENSEVDKVQEPSKVESEEPTLKAARHGDLSSAEQGDISGTETVTRRMEVPNNKVGVLIGKAGDTIRYLQYNTGAKIQITRDADADPHAATRVVEIIGSSENISKAERLINAVIAEADAGGSPSLVARGIGSSQVAATAERIEIQVPNEKVGLIIGRGGETIKSLQTRSGARIQLIPQHLTDGDAEERTVRVTGDKRQIDVAREMIKEVMNQNVRPSSLSSGYNQQGYRSRGPSGPSQWGPLRGPRPSHAAAYDYPQRGSYNNPQYSHPAFGNYPPPMSQRNNFNAGWEQRPAPHSMHGPPHTSGYDYYGGRAYLPEAPAAQHPNPIHGHGHGPQGPSQASAMGPPPAQPSHNYSQQQGPPDYGNSAPHSHTAPQQSYGHGGYDEQRYSDHAPIQNPYGGGQRGSLQSSYPQPTYDNNQQLYVMPAQGPPPQSTYGAPPRVVTSQPGGEMPFQQVSVPAPQSYASNVPPQQTYPPYGSAPDGYSNTQAAPTPTSYPQQGGYGYTQYPSSLQSYPEQAAPNTGYGYQDPASAYSNTVAQSYPQQTAAQPSYDQQSLPQSGAYAAAATIIPAGAPVSVGYGKTTVSPQPGAGYAQYDTTQMYGVPR